MGTSKTSMRTVTPEELNSLPMHDAELFSVQIIRTSETEIRFRTIMHSDEAQDALGKLRLPGGSLEFLLDAWECTINEYSGCQTGAQYIDDWRAERLPNSPSTHALSRLAFTTSMGSSYTISYRSACAINWMV